MRNDGREGTYSSKRGTHRQKRRGGRTVSVAVDAGVSVLLEVSGVFGAVVGVVVVEVNVFVDVVLVLDVIVVFGVVLLVVGFVGSGVA